MNSLSGTRFQNKVLQNLALLPGFNILNNEVSNYQNNIYYNDLKVDNRNVIENKIFMKFYSAINEKDDKKNESKTRKNKKNKKDKTSTRKK